MNVIVQAKTMPVTEAIREFAEKQAHRLDKMGVKISKVMVYLENIARKGNDPARSEVRYKVELAGKDIVIQKKAHDLYEAITEAGDSMLRRVRDFKEKQLKQQRHSIF